MICFEPNKTKVLKAVFLKFTGQHENRFKETQFLLVQRYEFYLNSVINLSGIPLLIRVGSERDQRG
jgi:hypothetical protein